VITFTHRGRGWYRLSWRMSPTAQLRNAAKSVLAPPYKTRLLVLQRQHPESDKISGEPAKVFLQKAEEVTCRAVVSAAVLQALP
jgi:hypothetical protein